MSTRISLRLQNQMLGFSLKSSTGYILLECHQAPVLMILSPDVKALQASVLDTKLRHRALTLLTRLCDRTRYLPSSYLLSDKFDLSGMPRASGGFADVRMGVLKGRDVAVKTLRISEVDDKAKIHKVGK